MAKTKQELQEIKSCVEELSAVLQELSEDELSTVLGGTVIDTRKDLYENIILGASPEEHNVMLNNALGEEMKVKCPYCFLMIPISKIDAHEAVCDKRSDKKVGWIG